MQTTIPKVLHEIASQYGDYPAQLSKDANGVFSPTTYSQLVTLVERFAAGLKSIGVSRGDHVGLVSENRAEWFITDLAVLSLGAADVPRGNDTVEREVAYILGFADCKIVCAEDAAQVRKILKVRDQLKGLKKLVVFAPGDDLSALKKEAGSIELLTTDDVYEAGDALLAENPGAVADEREQGEGDDVATLIFTSGTTGTPKGVMLTHGNFLHQVKHVPDLIDVGAGDIWLCVLPVWHSFERIMQYVSLGAASALAYSKPIGRILLEDFQKVRPTWMASVPRIWEAIQAGIYRNVKTQSAVKQGLFSFFVSVGSTHAHLNNMLKGRLPRFEKRNRVLDAIVAFVPWLLLLPLRGLGNLLVFGKIKQKLGGRFVAGISGGGALPAGVDSFFQAAGVLLLEGYGLTETGPVLGVRAQHHPVPSTVGPVFPGTEIRIIDENGGPLPPGTLGTIMARGPQVMKGYYKQPDLTAQMMNDEGWLNTGDLGMLTYDNELAIRGRAKDTIVLRGGENVEPLPIEQKLEESSLIDHAILQGQDQRTLGVLIVPNPDAVLSLAKERGIVSNDASYDPSLLENEEIDKAIGQTVRERVSGKTGFRAFERIGRHKTIAGPLSVGDELSQ
ncbi:MAG: AMP-dependent synthetase/ligase, partial [Spirochaetales bacterium]